MLHRFAQARTSVLAAVTKSDKLPRGQRASRVRALQQELGLDEDQVVATSARTGDGVAELAEAIEAFVAAAAA